MSEHKKYTPIDKEIADADEMMNDAQRTASDVRAMHHVQERDWYRESHPPDLDDASVERRAPTLEEARRMDATLHRLGELFYNSGLHWLLKGALNISLLRGAYIGVHKDVDVGIDVDELPALERVLASRGYGLFRSYYRGGKKGEGGVKVLERVGIEGFARERGGELEKPVIAAIDTDGKIRKGEPLNFFEVFPIEHDREGHLIGRMGAALPDKWKQPHIVQFQGVPINCSHPAMVAYFKLFNTRPYDKKDLAMLMETGVATMDDVAEIETIVTGELEAVTQKRREESRMLVDEIVTILQSDMSEEVFRDRVVEIPLVAKRAKKIGDQFVAFCHDIFVSDRSKESIGRIIDGVFNPRQRSEELMSGVQKLKGMVVDYEKRKELP